MKVTKVAIIFTLMIVSIWVIAIQNEHIAISESVEVGNNNQIMTSSLASGGVTNVIFNDDFSGDLSQWNLFGSPRPVIDNGALKGNGDGWYGSDAVTMKTFDRSKGDVSIEARIKISRTLRPGWFGYGDITSGDPNYDPSETVYYGFRFQGVLYGERLTFTYMKPGGVHASAHIPWPEYDVWHHYQVVVNYNGGADFFVDGVLRFSVPETEKEVAITNLPVIAGSHDSPYWFDDVEVNTVTPSEAIDILIEIKEEMNLHHGIENSLDVKLNAASKSYATGKDDAATNQLRAFINEVEAQQGQRISDTQANILILFANWIIEEL